MDFSTRPFRDEWLHPGQEAQPGDAPADVATPQEEQAAPPARLSLAVSHGTALVPSHERTADEDATPPEKTSARAALAVARGVAPESLTLAQWLSRELVLPEQLVRQTPQQALEELRARQLETNPHLAAWAGKSVQNAAHARENVEYLNRFRDAFAAFNAAYCPQKEQSFAEFMDSLGKPGEKLLHAVTNDVPEVAQNWGRVLTHGMANWNAGMAGNALAVAENVFGVDSAPARWARSARDWANWARPKEVKAETKLGQFGYDALAIAPQMAMNIMAGMANPAAAMSVMGAQIFGSSYNELRGKGVSPRMAAVAAGGNAAMQMPMERLGLDKMLGAIRATGAWKSLKKLFGAALTEGLTEFAQKWPEFVTHLWAEAELHGKTTGERVAWFARQVTDADNLMQAFNEAWYEGLLGTAWGGGFGAVGAGRSFRQKKGPSGVAQGKKPGILSSPEIREALTVEAEQARVMAQRQALGNALTQAASALDGAPAANDPAAMREMTEAVLPEEFRQGWIGSADAARLFQEAQARGDAEAAALLETLGTDEAGLRQAMLQGDVLPVNTATVLTQLRGDGRAAVLDALRVTPDGVSGAEAAAYDPEARAKKLVRSVLGMEEESWDGGRDAGDALREARSARKVRADVAREITRITQEIEAAGYPRHAAQTFARLLEHEAITAHTVYGVDPVSFILQRVSVARGEQEAEGGLGQAAMYRSTAKNIGEFVEQVRGEEPRSKQSVFVFGNVERPEAGLAGAALELPSDAVRHIGKRHPGFAGWENLEAVASQGDCYAIKPDPITKNPGRAFALVDGDKVLAILGYVKNGKNGERFIIETAFEGTQKGFAHWLKQKQATPLYQSAGGSPAQPKPAAGRVSELERNGLTEGTLASQQQDGKAGVLYQNGKPVEVSSAALGVPEGSGIRDYIKAAKQYHDRLKHESEHGKPVVQPELAKPVRFSRRGWEKNSNAGADKRKWQLFPYLREIIESSRLVRSEKPQGKHEGMKYVHWCENEVILDGQLLTVGFTLLEDEKGDLFYNIAADTSKTQKGKAPLTFPESQSLDVEELSTGEVSSRGVNIRTAEANVNVKEKSPSQLETLHQSRGREELHQDGSPSVDEPISANSDGVNLTLREATPGGIRGSVTLSPQEAAIRVFADKDLSTVPHEAGHIFLDDLMRIAADDGSLALATMRASLEGVLPRMGEEMRAEILAAVDTAAKATPETLAEALHDAATGLRARAQDARATVRLNRETARTLRREAGVAEDAATPAGESRPWDEFENEERRAGNDAADFTRAANIVARAAQHVRALEQARRDLAELKEWAGLAPDAELKPGTEDYTRFHEAVARGFEQYLMEGKAPSRKLEGVFSRLRQWLLRIYAAAREQLGLPINDNVRRVFDRMLATDAEVRRQGGLRRTMQAEREFAESGLLYFDELEALNELRNEAEQAVTAEMDRATLRERNKRFRAYYSDALRDLEASPFWEMVGALSRREKSSAGDASIGGINKDGVVRLLGPAAAADLARARPGLLNARGHGLPIDLAAMEYGYEDEDALAHDLYDALVVRGESKQKLARALAEQRLAEDDSAAEAEALLHGSEGYAAYLDKVDEVVARMAYARGLRTREEQARRVRNLITPRSVVQHWAWEELQHTRLADMRPERYQARLDKALRDRARALADGNAMEAVNAVQEARMANELIHLSREFLQRRDKLVTLAKATAAAKPGTYPPLYTAALRKLLGRFGLGNMRGGVDPVLATFSLRELVQKTVAEEDAGSVAPSFADWLLNGVNPATGIPLGNGTLRLGGLTPFELEEVENLLKYLRHAGYNERAEARKSEAAKVQLLEDAAVAAMRDLPDAATAPAHTLRRRLVEGGRSLYAAVDSLRWEMRKADGFQNVTGQGEAGPMEQMFNEMLAGEERARARVGQVSRDMAPHLVHLSQSVAAWEKKYGKHLMLKGQDGKPVKLPESLDKAYGKGWTADMVLALALNMGNESNMARLVAGYPDLTYDTLAELVGDAMATRAFNAARGTKDVPRGNRHGLLSAADWQAVQGIWDALATQWADTQKVHERMFGFLPKGVEAAPFRVADADGNVVSLRGGYYPVRYDPNVSQQVAQWGEKEDLLSRNESVFAVPAAKRGHTQARSERAPGLPVRLNTGIIMEHINDVVRLIELGEITRRADRVTQGAAFRAEYIRAFGKEDYDAIRPNLRGLVRQEPPPKSDVAVTTANFVRRYLVPWGLAWNLKVAALQMTAVFPAMGDLGTGPMLRSMAHMSRHPLAIREIWAVSPYMKSRMSNIDQDLQRNIANFNPGKRPASLQVGGKEITWEDVVNLGMLPIVAVDTMATGAVWMAAYTKKLSELQGARDVRYGISTESEFHEQAVAFADSMVKQSNPDYDPSSRSGFLRAQNAYRLLNGFASAVTLFAARHRYMYTARKKGKITRWQLARFELYETLLPACAMFLFLALARGYWGDKDEPEDIARLAVGSLADFATMRVPIFGSAVGDGLLNLMGLGDGGRQGGLRTTIDEPFRQLATLTGRVGQVVKKGQSKDTVKNLSYAVGDVLSFALRVPVSKIARNAERGYDQWQRGQGTAFSVLMPRPGK